MISLQELEGTLVHALIPAVNGDTASMVRIVKVETSGLWIESQKMTDLALQTVKVSVAQNTPVIFVPWHGVTFLISAIDKVSLSEQGLGVEH
jgi:hypothetical protein